MTNSQLMQGTGMTNAMYERWRSHKFIAQSDSAENSDARPVGRVFITRGHMQRTVVDPTFGAGVSFRTIWDEKYRWFGRPGQHPVHHSQPPADGLPRNPDFRDPVEIPSVSSISIRNNIDQNGIATATVVVQNVYREPRMGDFLYHVMREGFFSPHFNGDEDFDVADVDIFSGGAPKANMARNADGKVLTQLVFPNRKIEIFQGYGDEIQRTFVGLIDSVSIDTKSGKMTMECTDFGRTLTQHTYTQFSTPPGRYPVAFCDWDMVKGVSRDGWVKKFGIVRTATPVVDVTHVAGRILGWSGFYSWNRVRAGRIGKTNTGYVTVRSGRDPGRRAIRAVFTGENFEKGAYFIDGINQIKTLLGYLFFMTPDFDPRYPNADRFRDPDVYDDEYSMHTIGIPNFVPPNVWNKNPVQGVEQFMDSEILLDGGLIYDYQSLRKTMYVVGSGLKTKRGRPRTIGYAAPYDICAGFSTPIFFNVHDELGIKLSELEIKVFIRLVMLQTLLQFNRGQFTVPGWPAATLNKQVDIFEQTTGTWRRFYVTGFESEMELGPKSSWRTSVEVINLDNIYITRIKRQIKKMLGVDQDLEYNLPMSKNPQTVDTPSWINRPAARYF